MKRIFQLIVLIVIMFCIAETTPAQQVISSAGGVGSNGSGTIAFTIGELVIDTQTSDNTTLTQGFQQTKLTITAIHDDPELSFFINVFPNPACDMVTIKTDGYKSEKLGYVLFDQQGKLLTKGDLLNGGAFLSFALLPASTYILTIVKEGKYLKTLKIVKQ